MISQTEQSEIDIKGDDMKFIYFVMGLVVGCGLVALQPTAAAPEPEIKTVVKTKIETKYITKVEKVYIKVNQTEPVEMIATAYTAGPESTGKRPGMKDYGITRTGTQVKLGVCAVDPKYIPLGTSLFVGGYGYCRAEDTGGKVKGYHVDVYMDKLKDALKFGREKRKVWILKNYEGERG